MTEFRKFSAALDDAKLTLQTAAATDNSDSATARRDAAEAIRRRCADGDLRRTADKFATRLEANDHVIDPSFLATLQTARRARDAAAARVHDEEEGAAEELAAAEEVVGELEAEAPSRTVQKPRYGATMRAKVAAARDRLEATLRTAAEVVDALDVDVAAEEEARERAAADEAARRERAEEASERAAADALIEEERSEREAAERAAAARRLDAARAQQADEARAARRARRDARRAAEADDRSQKEQASRAWRRGVASVDAALRTLAASAGEAYGDAVAALRDILEAIVEKPDDDARRRLRCANAAFARDVDNFEGGRQVLFSAGFQLTHRSSGVEPAQDNEEDDWQVWESLLVLREPNPLSDGFDAWTAWFDNLKACHARLRDEAERLEASRPSKGLLAGAAPSWVDTKRSLY